MTLILHTSVYYVTVFVFLLMGLWAGRNGIENTDNFLTARSTQSWIALGINFFAAGLGVSAFYIFPQIGSLLGVFGVFAYSVAMVVPLLVLAVLGPILRQKVPNGVTITEFVRVRFGWAAFVFTNIITLVYMSVFLISELTSLGFLLESYNIQVLPAQIIICLTTTLYTALSGMRASLFTDNFQGWIVILLMSIISVAFGLNVKIDPNILTDSPLLIPSGIAIESLYTLTVASLSANIFHQGYWQRVYSAKNDRELVKSSVFASILTFPVMFLIGMTGVIAVWSGLADTNDPLAFFKIMDTLPSYVRIFVLILATAFISSSVDTLQNGIVATIVNDIFMNQCSLNVARIVTALLNIPVIVIAAKGINVMTLFLIADLCAAVIVCPVFIGVLFGKVVHLPHDSRVGGDIEDDEKSSQTKMSPTFLKLNPQETNQNARLPNGFDFCMGVFGGITSVVVFGTLLKGSVWQGFELLTLPNELTEPGESIGAFVCAPLGSVVAMILSWLSRNTLGLIDSKKRESITLFNGNL